MAKSPDSPSPVHRYSQLDGIYEPWDTRLIVVPYSQPRSAAYAETPDSESPATITKWVSNSPYISDSNNRTYISANRITM